MPATTLYREQRATGVLNFSKLAIKLPAVTIPGTAVAGPAVVVRPRKAVVTIGLPGSRGSKRGAMLLKVRVRVRGKSLSTALVRVHDAAGRRLGTARTRALRAGGSRLVTVRLTRPIEHGRYRIGVSYSVASGATGAAARTVVLG